MMHFSSYGNISQHDRVYIGSMMDIAPRRHYHYFIVVLLLACSPMFALAQPMEAPDLRCASVNVAGDVTLTWLLAADPGGTFVEHTVFSSADVAGPFVQVGVITDPLQTTFLHVGAGAGTGARFYYITTTSSVPPVISAPSDTLATLYLEVFQSTPLGSANLAWNAPSTAGTADSQFSIWMEYPIGNWNLLGFVSNTTFAYQHVISICQDSLTFRVGLADDSGCISFSNRDGDVFEDVTPPSPPVIISATVDSTTGQPVITWEPSPEADTEGYIIVLVTPGGGVIIDTLFGAGSTTYTWAPGSPDLGPESFTVAAFDTCRVGVPPSPNTSATRPQHTTMYATTEYDRCAGAVSIRWTPYVGWPVVTYQVLVQVDGGPWAVLQNVGGSQLSVLHNVEPDRTYCYIVKAMAQGGAPSSLSNKTCRTATYPSVPNFNYLRTVTVTGAEEITVVDSVDVAGAVSGYRFERSANGAPFEVVAQFPGGTGPLITYVDTDVAPDVVGYRYRVAVMDSCGNEALVSNIGGNIVLRASSNLYGENLLDWNGYAQWAGV
ncbi:MAG: fibronectin type III domain-containing protein, partial [Flavobacteriales bacterium]